MASKLGPGGMMGEPGQRFEATAGAGLNLLRRLDQQDRNHVAVGTQTPAPESAAVK
jgi:hypothetical protein